jgi:hypothetical protein
MAAAAGPLRRRVAAVLLAQVAAVGAQAAPASASATLWSADRSFTPCRSSGVEMIVGGAPEPTGCPNERQPAPSASVARDARVGAGAQRLRDDDRRAILLQEVARERDEQSRLAAAPSSDANRQALERVRTNLAALQRELARTP